MKSFTEPFTRNVRRIEPEFAENAYGIVKRLRVIEEWLAPSGRPLRILDFGCGTGEQVTFPLAKAGHQVVGFDTHEPSMVQARQRFQLPNLEFRAVSTDERFDAIICSEVLEHLEHPAKLLIDLNRLLQAGGMMIVTTPNGRGSYEMLCTLERLLIRTGIHALFRRFAPHETQNASDSGFLNQESVHVQFFRLKQLQELFEGAGFQVAERRPRTFLCGPYVDLLFRWMPFRDSLIRFNANVADSIPLWCAADWMFLLKKI